MCSHLLQCFEQQLLTTFTHKYVTISQSHIKNYMLHIAILFWFCIIIRFNEDNITITLMFNQLSLISYLRNPFLIMSSLLVMYLYTFSIHWTLRGFTMDILRSTGTNGCFLSECSLICWYIHLPYQSSNRLLKNAFTAMFTLISRGCSQSVQLAGTMTM